MLLIGCALAFLVALAPRVVLILAAIFSERWDLVWGGNWFWPLVGIIFAPYTTDMYMLSWNPVTGIVGFDWVWIVLGVILDVMKWAQVASNRRRIPGYPVSQPATPQASSALPAPAQPESGTPSEPTA